MSVSRLSFTRGARRFSVLVIRPDRSRRRRIARAMAARGLAAGRIALALRISPRRLPDLLAEPRLFDPALLRAAARELA